MLKLNQGCPFGNKKQSLSASFGEFFVAFVHCKQHSCLLTRSLQTQLKSVFKILSSNLETLNNFKTVVQTSAYIK